MFFFFNDTATTEIYTLSLHDALPIYGGAGHVVRQAGEKSHAPPEVHALLLLREAAAHHHIDDLTDRKSTRLNSSHANISYAVFCLKKKKTNSSTTRMSSTVP